MAAAPYHSASMGLSGMAGHCNEEPIQPALGPRPTTIKCPECGAQVCTSVEHRASSMTHFLSIMMCWSGCLCCLPYFIDSCRKVDHSCPTCNAYIGTYKS